MRKKHIIRSTLSARHIYGLLLICLLLAGTSLTCDNGESPVLPPSPTYDPFRPTIESFTAMRDGTEIDDDIVYSGEDIALVVQATSHAFPQSCGLDEGETVEGNLVYTFRSIPPDDIPAPGLISQSSPPYHTAIWRVPNLDNYDPGEGLLYTLQVTVLDECLDKSIEGSINLRAFANQGAPVISEISVHSAVGSGNPVEEILDQNGYYEVESGDECRISIDAQSRTGSDICANRGVPSGDELAYIWSSSYLPINLSYNQDPARADSADFDIPTAIEPGDTFTVDCLIRDRCTGTESTATMRFIAVAAPEITSIEGTANGINLTYDPYFDTNLVLPEDEIILTATGMVMDDLLCDAKGIHPDLEWNWTETSGSSPVVSPEYDPRPVPNETSMIEFVVPAAQNGTDYSFRCTLTDRCNSLADVENINFMVIVPPQAELTFVQRGANDIQPAQDSGRYEVSPGDVIKVRITGTAASGTSFCEARGISIEPPVEYFWLNPWDEILIFNYEQRPSTDYSDMVMVVPDYAPAMDAELICRVTDICNDLSADVSVPFRIIED